MVEFIPSPLPWPLEASGCDVYYSWIEALKAGVHDDTLFPFATVTHNIFSSDFLLPGLAWVPECG